MIRLAPTPFADDARWPAVPGIRRQPSNYPFVVDAYPRRIRSSKLLRIMLMIGFCGAVWGLVAGIAWWVL